MDEVDRTASAEDSGRPRVQDVDRWPLDHAYFRDAAQRVLTAGNNALGKTAGSPEDTRYHAESFTYGSGLARHYLALLDEIERLRRPPPAGEVVVGKPWRPVLLSSERGELRERLGGGPYAAHILNLLDELERRRSSPPADRNAVGEGD